MLDTSILNVLAHPLQVFSREELELVASLCQQHDVVCITDEVYQWLVFDGFQHISIGEPSRPGRPVPPDLCGRALSPVWCQRRSGD